MNTDQILLEVNTREKFSVIDKDDKFAKYKELADKGLINLEALGFGIYIVSKIK